MTILVNPRLPAVLAPYNAILVVIALLVRTLMPASGFAQQPGSATHDQKSVVAPSPTLTVQIPDEQRQFPEPLPAERSAPGFKLRGIKGWMWRPAQYLAEIPVLAQHRMNFMMNCYTSMCDIEHHAWGEPDCNRWWEPLPADKKKAYEEVVHTCARQGVTFCFCMNPNLSSKRFADPDNAQDVADLWQHYHWMQDLGVKWFSICLDDIGHGADPTMQAKLVNEILRRLRARDPQAQMIFCPTYFCGNGTNRGAECYLKVIAAELEGDVYVFWTGDAIVAPRITRTAAKQYGKLVAHKLILWDNYPVNDNTPTMNLGPVTGRDPDLCEAVEGYMSNSLCPQNEINRIPMLTCADYAYNPWQYDPDRSIGQVILRMAGSKDQRSALAELVEAYPGNLRLEKGYTFNPVRSRFSHLDSLSDGGAQAGAFVHRMDELLHRFQGAFPRNFPDARKTLSDDIGWMRTALANTARE